jgi:hypothetical protein
VYAPGRLFAASDVEGSRLAAAFLGAALFAADFLTAALLAADARVFFFVFMGRTVQQSRGDGQDDGRPRRTAAAASTALTIPW